MERLHLKSKSKGPNNNTTTTNNNNVNPNNNNNNSPSISSNSTTTTIRNEALLQLEQGLSTEIEYDFFQDPKSFRTLHRVIDVLGAQVQDEVTTSPTNNNGSQLDNNPAYIALKRQQDIVEDAIEYMAVKHCADLNASVVAVGLVSRKFDDAIERVKSLRSQVRDIKMSLGTNNLDGSATAGNNGGNKNKDDRKVDADGNPLSYKEGSTTNTSQQQQLQQQHASKSLRELWLKKLECEAVLSLLHKLEIIRDAPTQFDALINYTNNNTQPCRIGSAVVLLSNAINTMFSDDVAQVQALTKVMDQLMTRKLRAEGIVWDTVHDVLYLRTGNGSGGGMLMRQSGRNAYGAAGGGNRTSMMNMDDMDNGGDHHSYSDDNSSCSGDSTSTGYSRSSMYRHAQSSSSRNLMQQQQQQQYGKTIPISVLKSELDLEEEELRCLEDHSSSGLSSPNHHLAIANNSGGDGRSLPRYNDATLALRILMEALARLGRLDDVERFLSESLGRELRHVAELEQARTYTKLERRRIARLKKKRGNMTMNRNVNQQKNHLDGTKKGGKADVKPLRQHLVSLLFAYENVMTRLTHMAQMLRYRIANDATLVTPSYTVPSSALHSILVTADRIIQREIKDFLRACLTSQASTNPSSPKGGNNNNNSNSNHPSSLLGDTTTVNPSDCRIFSLGIISNDNDNNGGHATDGTSSSKVKKDGVPSIADHPSSTTTFGYSSNMMDLPTDQFVTTILFPRTNTSPSVRHALAFRSCLAKFNHEITLLREELAIVTNEDTSSPSYQVSSSTDSNALEYLDSLIGRQLLPLLQDEAVQTTVSALESDDAFLPVFPNTIYTSLTSSLDQNNHQNQPLCMACQVLLDASAPLFSALRRLPKGVENLYSPLVAVLEHAVLAFISRAKKRVRKICGGKKADDLLGGENSVKSKTGLSVAVELRNAYLLFMQSYEGGGVSGNGGGIMNSHAGVLGGMEGAGVVRDGAAGILPLAPSTADTRAKYGSGGGENKKKQGGSSSGAGGSGIGGDGTAVMSREREDEALTKEMENVQFLFRFKDHHYGNDLIACTDDELMHAASLAHSLLKLSVSLEKRLRRETTGSTRALREAIGTIRTLGRRMAKFCRIDVLVHTAKRVAKICKSSALLSSDAVRIPTCVNDLGDFLTNTSDILRETGGNGITAYTLSNLEQYIPLLIMQSVRNLGLSNDDDYGEYGSVSSRKRRDAGSISMQGIESLARSGSVLYRDLKNAVGFEGSFWDDVAACDAFERGDSFVQLLELDAEGLEEYYLNNKSEFSDYDYKHMFSINCPNRKGDSRKFNNLKR